MFDPAPYGLTHGDGNINTCPRGDYLPPTIHLSPLPQVASARRRVHHILEPYELHASQFNATFPRFLVSQGSIALHFNFFYSV